LLKNLNMNKNNKIKSFINVRNIIIAAFILTAALTVFFMIKVVGFYNTISTPPPVSSIPEPTKTPEEQHIYTVLLAGYGGGNHEGTYLTDTLMVIRIDMKQKKALLISLPRDIWVNIPTKNDEVFREKINAVYQMGLFANRYPAIDKKYSGEEHAGQLLKDVVGSVLDMPIDAYITINFAGFVRVVDLLGGIDVEVARSFDDYEYPITGEEDNLCDDRDESMLPDLLLTVTVSPREAFPCRYEHLHFDAGMNHMDGETALKYVRSRHSLQDGTDFGRAARQQLFLQAVREKVISIGFLPKIVPLLDELSSYIRMDMALGDIQKLLGEASADNEYKVDSFIPSDADYLTPSRSSYGSYILVPNEGVDQWGSVQNAIKDIIEGVNIESTPSGELVE